ncbi:hypothetical protein [Natrinema altunense]|uniref:Uncharacterized protein n=1 Tax=Natrinema altunense TaxID=222984 RepID=A0A482Y237_9EURY|nr:hypothetical protein [Natrinema altunense]RZH67826.1 hypothetical protein ELS17_09835 [Natrinema altunense]
MATYDVISSPDPNPNVPHDPNWPRVVKISVEAEEGHLLQGKGHGLGGSFYSFDEFSVTEWADLFDGWDANWLVEALSAQASLAAIDEAAFVETLQQHVRVRAEER